MHNETAERKWAFRPLTEGDIEAYLDIYLNAYPAYKALDAECRQHYREKHLLELREDSQTCTVGLFEGDTLIGTMKLILFSMNFFGQMQPACGLRHWRCIRSTRKRARRWSWCGISRTMPGKTARC